MSGRFYTVVALRAAYAHVGLRPIECRGNAWLWETGWKTAVTLQSVCYPGDEGPETHYFDEMQCVCLDAFIRAWPAPDNWNGKRGQ